jgi:ElaB/YqjD/DUF883 family membrane-anchored ribosome-binding protein
MQRTTERMSENAPGIDTPLPEEGIAFSSVGDNDSERFFSDLKRFVSDTESLLRDARTLSGEGAVAARAEFERRLAQARDGFDTYRNAAMDRAHVAMDRTETYVRDEPWKAIGIAALVGAVVGVMLARR